jgi:hypothetical protein
MEATLASVCCFVHSPRQYETRLAINATQGRQGICFVHLRELMNLETQIRQGSHSLSNLPRLFHLRSFFAGDIVRRNLPLQVWRTRPFGKAGASETRCNLSGI